MNEKYTKYIGFDSFNYVVNISLLHKYVYVETPKVACSTIKSTLQKIELDDSSLKWGDFEEIHVRDKSPLIKPSQVHDFNKLLRKKEYFKFCFVRNPYSRILSVYLEKIVGNKSQKRNILAQLGMDVNDLSIEISFKDFVVAVYKQPIDQMNGHWRNQYYQTMQHSIKYNFIGKLETFDIDFKHVLAKLGIANSGKYYTEERRHRSDADEKIKQYYTEEIRDIVYSKYKKDFDYFKYSNILEPISDKRPNKVKL